MTIVSPMMGKKFVPNGYREIVAFGHVIESAKLDWTVVRFLMPVNEQTGAAKVTFGDKNIKWKISREEIAQFVFEQLTDKSYIRSMPIIGC